MTFREHATSVAKQAQQKAKSKTCSNASGSGSGNNNVSGMQHQFVQHGRNFTHATERERETSADRKFNQC